MPSPLQIRVEFIDVDNDTLLESRVMPPGDLPPRIDPGIELYVGDEEWILIEAQRAGVAGLLQARSFSGTV
jgi:hypothetical protein